MEIYNNRSSHPAHFGPENSRRRSTEDLSDSGSCTSYSTEEDSYSYKLRRGLKQANEATMKKLLAEELSKEAEVRRRPPSVIGRLMGLDTLPPQQPVVKLQKKFSDNYLKKTASIGGLNKRSVNEGRSRGVSNKEQQEFKDVYEVKGSLTAKKRPDLRMQKKLTDSYTDQNRMEYVRQKFMDVKRLSTDEKLQHSKEYHEALEVLYSNKDILVKFLQEPDSMFTKHLRNLHGFSSPPPPGHVTIFQSSNVQETMGRKSDKSIERHDEQNAVGHSRRKNIYIPSKLSKSQTQEKEPTCQLPTRIVVLKPNLKKVQNTVSLISSPNSSEHFPLGHRRNKGCGSFESLELFDEVCQRRDSSFELDIVNRTIPESREIAREITRQMRHGVSRGPRVVTTSRLRRYADDESSDSLSGSDSAYEPDVRMQTSRRLNDLKSKCSPLSSHSTESSVSREAKKRLSERWKMTQRAPEVRRVSRGSTLGEMLSMPDKETRLTNVDPLEGINDRLSGNGGVSVTRCVSPLGISSRDGWKDEYVRNLPRSRSLPASSTCLSSPKRNLRYGTLPKDKCPLVKESTNWRSPRRLDSQQGDDFFLKSNRKLSRKKSPYSLRSSPEEFYQGQDYDLKRDTWRYGDGEKRHFLQDTDLKADELSLSFERLGSPESEPSTLDIPVDELIETTHSVNDREFLANNSNLENTPEGVTEGNSIFSRCTVTEAESAVSSKEAGQPSPVSVLEAPFEEEVSTSNDTFQKIKTDLHGLRMQLQLLKSESSDAYSEGSEMIVSSDEDIREGSLSHSSYGAGSSGICKDEVNRDYSYIVDVLVDSGFHDMDLDILLRTWHTLELPVAAPTTFSKLEKTYGEQTSWLRSDRKLLFDRINMGLVELLQPHMDPHPWVKLEKPIACQWSDEPVAGELRKLLLKQDKQVSDSMEKTLQEMSWLDLRDDTEAVGNEIEKLLFGELVDEAICSLVVA